MGSCEEFVLQLKGGATQSGGAAVTEEVAASALGLGPGDPIDIRLSPQQQPPLSQPGGASIALPPGAAFLHLRDYYFDWQAGPPATFVLERVGGSAGPRPGRTPGRVAALLTAAADEIEHSFTFWSGYQQRLLDDQPANAFTVPGAAAGGVQAIVYAHSGVALAADQALVVELGPADAPLWDVQLYNRPWYEALDFAHRSTSTNHRMAAADPDGRVRIVISARDTGAVNWLDTEARASVLATVRWWNAPQPPTIRAEVAALDTVRGPVTPDQRRARIDRRAAHAAWRYRT